MKAKKITLFLSLAFILGLGMCLAEDASVKLEPSTAEVSTGESSEVKTSAASSDSDFERKFSWWPTDAQPAPVKDTAGGWWWWPKEPGTVGPLWGNRGYCYVNKIIFDYKSDELPEPQPQELRASLLIKNINKNVKIYFGFNSSKLRDDAVLILKDAVKTLNRYPDNDILITGNCDIRGTEKYNEKLGKKRADALKKFMIKEGIPEERIRIISRGKLDAIAHITDLEGMQKDRNAQFMIAEVEEVMLPYNGSAPLNAKMLEEGKLLEEVQEEVTSQSKVSTRKYTVKKGDTLWKIAQKELGNGARWKYIFELNKNQIKNSNKLKVGQELVLPVE